MPLHPAPLAPDLPHSLERIFVYGAPDTGKTTGWMQIAETLRKGGATSDDIRFWVLDTDYTVSRSLEEYPELARSRMVQYEVAPDWGTAAGALKDFGVLVQGRPNDWIVVDMINPLWDMAQENYIERVFGKDADEFFAQHRLAQKRGGALDGFKDWSVINRFYNTRVAEVLKRAPCHVYAVASGKAVSSDLDSKLIREQYQAVGTKPAGQKDTTHLYHTVLLARKRAGGTVDSPIWTLTTIKDRAGRKRLAQVESSNFAMSYLVRVAGWRP
jgi:hypothetical protein